MRDKTKEKYSEEASYALKDLDKAAEVALFYGFTPIKSLRVNKEDLDKADTFREEKRITENRNDIFPQPEEKISLLRTCLQWNLFERELPIMIYYKRPLGGSLDRKSPNEFHCGLDIIGSISSICEAIAVKTAYSILSDHGYKDLTVDINSIGDKDSISRFESELSSFIRKNVESIPAELRPVFRKNPFEAILSRHKDWTESKGRLPQSMSSLSEPSINHFKEVLEYFESLDIPYRVAHDLVGSRHYCSHTIFEIKDSPPEGTESTVFAVGTRHNHISKKIGFKKDIPIMSVNLRFKKPKIAPKIFFRGKLRPKFYFIQFGSRAKLKSLIVIETLRQARIPVHHSLTHDQFVGQLSNAEKKGSSFVIIMGQKEAMDNTVVVRHVATRIQETVPIFDLAKYLVKLK